MRHKPLIVLLFAIIALWAYSGLIGQSRPTPAPQDAVHDLPDPGPAPDIAITPVNSPGRSLSLSALKGKVVLLDFWATWCGPCRMSMPGIEKLYQSKHAKGFEVIGVAIEHDDGSQIPAAVKEIGITYPVGLPTLLDNVKPYSDGSIPRMVLGDKKGRVRWEQTGYDPNSTDETLAQQVAKLLAE